MGINKQISDLLYQADKIAENEVERLARKILKEHPELDEFIMAIGAAFFTDNKDNNINIDQFEYFKELRDFILYWDNSLKITGNPMRFTATGKKITNW